MAAPRHKILRQVLEVRGCPPEAARHMDADLRRVCSEELLPVIDRICSEMSPDGRIHRIDKLELDFGPARLERLLPQLTEHFEETFRRELADVLGRAPEGDSDAELFTWFAQTGTLPWWADGADARLLDTALQALLARPAATVRRALAPALSAEHTRQRIARSFSDRLLAALVHAISPASSEALVAMQAGWLSLLAGADGARGLSPREARSIWWESVLHETVDGRAVLDSARFYRSLAERTARAAGLDHGAWLDELVRVASDGASVPPPLRAIVQALRDVRRGEADDDDAARATEPLVAGHGSIAATAALAALLDRIEALAGAEPFSWAQIEAALDSAPRELQVHTAAALAAARARLNAGAAPRAAAQGLHLELRTRFDASAQPASDRARKAAEAVRARSNTDRSREMPDLAFSATDALYVENAGLVVLWPFLARYFERLGLVEDGAFKDEAAAHRAAGLLQYVAAGETEPLEYRLVLNKLLCGLSLECVFDFGPEITAQEIEESTDLLRAAIGQAPVLREMSIDGFRGSFLLRAGQLTARDGEWLLRVERETYDIVLDRFPWGVAIVRLPWMDAILHVEW